MAVNQKQIAEKVGVSIALVSRVLSGTAHEIGIAQATIERVLRAAEEMGYVPSAAALGLKGKATRTIGVAVYDFNDPYFAALIREIQVQAQAHRYSLVLAGFLRRTPGEQDLQAFHKHAIDGLIILGSDATADWLDAFDHLPIARIGHGRSGEWGLQAAIDEADAAHQLLAHLKSRGRSRLVGIACPLNVHQLRQQALCIAAEGEGVSFSPLLSDQIDPFRAGLETVKTMLSSQSEVDALVCATDQIAMGALHALSDAGIRVPNDMAVTGFDDIPAASQFLPPITTMQQPLEEMVQHVFKAVIEPAISNTHSFKGKLVVRSTT